MTDLVFYLLVFFAVGVFFLFIHMVIGKCIRPSRPDDEKLTIYECGEPTVGSAWIQFDLRYYVVALLFVVFDVEVAFFFPWAVVFGKANELSHLQGNDASVVERRAALTKELVPADLNLAGLETPSAPGVVAGKKAGEAAPPVFDPRGDAGGGKKAQASPAPQVKGMSPIPGSNPDSFDPLRRPADVAPIDPVTAKSWAWIAFFDILVFFSVLMVGFAYLWRRGDIDWVRSMAAENTAETASTTAL